MTKSRISVFSSIAMLTLIGGCAPGNESSKSSLYLLDAASDAGSRQLDATTAISDFFESHPRQDPP